MHCVFLIWNKIVANKYDYLTTKEKYWRNSHTKKPHNSMNYFLQ